MSCVWWVCHTLDSEPDTWHRPTVTSKLVRRPTVPDDGSGTLQNQTSSDPCICQTPQSNRVLLFFVAAIGAVTWTSCPTSRFIRWLKLSAKRVVLLLTWTAFNPLLQSGVEIQDGRQGAGHTLGGWNHRSRLGTCPISTQLTHNALIKVKLNKTQIQTQQNSNPQ